MTRFAGHELFDPNVLSIVKCLVSGERSLAFEQLQREASSPWACAWELL